MTAIGATTTSVQLAAHPRQDGRAQADATAAEEGAQRGPDGLTDEQRAQVQKLRETDQEVRAHEQAHARAGGPYASAPRYDYVRGPDGKRYAVSGEVQIDSAPVGGNPKATIRKMEVVIRAALAPAEPSAQDSKVAAQARANKAEAQIELRQQEQQEARDDDPSPLEEARNPDTARQSAAAAAYAAQADAIDAAFALAISA